MQWIWVTDELPKRWTDVLIYHVLGDSPRSPKAIDVAWLTDKDEWLFPWDRNNYQRPQWVRAWMPLPLFPSGSL